MNSVSRGKVLVVDDERSVRSLLRAHLEDAGFEVHEAPDGRTAVKAGDAYDVIVLDMYMPDMEGLETIQQLRRQNARARIVAISGSNDPHVLPMALRFGATCWFRKPFSPVDLTQEIITLLSEAWPAGTERS